MRNRRWRDPFGLAAFLRDPGIKMGGVVLVSLAWLGVQVQGCHAIRAVNHRLNQQLSEGVSPRPAVPSASVVADPELTLRQIQATGLSRSIRSIHIQVVPTGYLISVSEDIKARR